MAREGIADLEAVDDADAGSEGSDVAAPDQGVAGRGRAPIEPVTIDVWREWHDSGEDWRPDVFGMPSYRELRSMLGEEKQRVQFLRRILLGRIDRAIAESIDPGYRLELEERGLL